MNLLLAIPLEFRLVGLFVLGTLLGSLANLAVWCLREQRTGTSLWSPGPAKAPKRNWGDRLPVVGWLGLRRESNLHGAGFWVRPMLVELLAGLGLAALYWWEVGRLGLLPNGMPPVVPAGWMTVFHLQYLQHIVLIWLMLVASLIDAEEKFIPDEITVPGTLIALAAAAVYPWLGLPTFQPAFHLPAGQPIADDFWKIVPLQAWPVLWPTAPNPCPAWMDGSPNAASLVIGLSCFWLWCVGLMPRVWHDRYGWRKAVRFFFAKLARMKSTYWLLGLGVTGSAAIGGVWTAGGFYWRGLLTALVGMLAGGGIVWLVRVVGTGVLKREAMGFGDVTLMAMIGAFLGWQAAVIIFFLAPFAALGIGVVQLITHRDHEIPYGPFLCLATVAVLVGWASIWDRVWRHFLLLGNWIPLVLAVVLVLMAVLLGLMKVIFRR